MSHAFCFSERLVHRKPSLQRQREQKKIKAIFDDEKGRVGAPRITKQLNHEGDSVGKNRVAQIMKKNGWRRSENGFMAYHQPPRGLI